MVAGEPESASGAGGRGAHDLGGLAAGPVAPATHDPEPWEKTVDAIMRLLSDPARNLMTVDELRRGIEGLGPDAYEALSYYERWIASITQILLEKGVIEVDELGRMMAAVETERAAARRQP